jgi:hypothetical protein
MNSCYNASTEEKFNRVDGDREIERSKEEFTHYQKFKQKNFIKKWFVNNKKGTGSNIW